MYCQFNRSVTDQDQRKRVTTQITLVCMKYTDVTVTVQFSEDN